MKFKKQVVDNRLRLLGFAVITLSGVLLWRMFDVMVVNHQKYLILAQGQQRFDRTEMGARGNIYVHDSPSDESVYYPLAFDMKRFAVWAVPGQIKDKKLAAEVLSPLLGLNQEEVFSKINNNKLYIPPLKRGLTLDESEVVKNKKLAGILVIPEYSRNYPEGSLASQVLGFVNNEGVGNYGVEGHYDNELKGKEGSVKGEQDTLGRVINLLEQKDPQNGTSYVLTIDRSVQYFVEKSLDEAILEYKADSGSIVIMDVKTGGILAMASTPDFDPNSYKEQAKSDPALFVNPVISYLYEPGSVFKPLIMAAAIDNGTVTPETTGDFASSINVDGFEIHTAENKAFGHEDMAQVLQNSDNVAMVWLSEKIGSEAMYQYIKKFNLLDKTGIDLDTEVVGKVPSLKSWRNINRATIAFGQGISLTPIEMLAAYATLANGGKYIYPHIVDKVILADGGERKFTKREGEQVISNDTANKVKDMLYKVVRDGHSKKAGVAGFKISAKTGTAQIPDPVAGGYLKSDDGLGIFNHTLAGFGPTEDPRFAMIVKLEKPKTTRYAESTSGPLFGKIASFLLNYHYRLQPTEGQ